MSLFGASVATMLATLAIAFLLVALRKPKLQDRLVGLAPGAALNSRLRTEEKSRARRITKKSANAIDAEMPDLIELIAVALSSGLSMHQALSRVASRSSTKFSSELEFMLKRVDLGSRFDVELNALCQRTPTPAVREFANKISIALARGTPLVLAFNSLSETLRSRQANILLAKAGSNETKMLIPLVTLVLPTTVIFAIYPSIQFLNLALI
jgi:tight adherence protein C